MAEIAPILPHSLEAERALLGAVLIGQPETLNKILACSLSTSDFFLPFHRTIWMEFLAFREHKPDTPIDLVTFSDWLAERGKFQAAGGHGYVAGLGDGLQRTNLNLAHYAQIIREKAHRRRIMQFAERVQKHAGAGEDIGELEKELAALRALPESAASNGNGNENGNGQRRTYYPLIDFMSTDFPIPEHLVDGVIPRGGSVLVLAMPHRLKSWFTIGLALGCTRAGKVFDSLNVPRAVRTLIVQVEDPEGVMKDRMRQLLLSGQFSDCHTENVGIIGRTQFTGFSVEWAQWLRDQVRAFKPDLVILDVLRRFFVGRGDLNSPQDSGDFLEEMDRIRDEGAAVLLVHHENRKDAELMAASAGSYNFPGWANVVIQLKRKTEQGTGENRIARVEIEADNKLGVAPESMRLVLNLGTDAPLRMEHIGDDDADFIEIMDHLSDHWNVRDLLEELGVNRRNAQNRISTWLLSGRIEKVTAAKSGRGGGMARYRLKLQS